MKKLFIVMFVVAMAAACGGKKAAPAKPAAGSDMKAPAGEGTDMKGDMKGDSKGDAPPPAN